MIKREEGKSKVADFLSNSPERGGCSSRWSGRRCSRSDLRQVQEFRSDPDK